MKKPNISSSIPNSESARKIKWFNSPTAKKKQSLFIKNAKRLASTVNESRQIPASVVKEPFTL